MCAELVDLEKAMNTLEHPLGWTRLAVAEGADDGTPVGALLSVSGWWLCPRTVLPPGNKRSCRPHRGSDSSWWHLWVVPLRAPGCKASRLFGCLEKRVMAEMQSPAARQKQKSRNLTSTCSYDFQRGMLVTGMPGSVRVAGENPQRAGQRHAVMLMLHAHLFCPIRQLDPG